MPTVTESDVIRGVYVVEPDIHGDERGLFIETYRREWIPGAREMIQANRSNKQAGALVGIHYHLHQSDYWYVPFGTMRVVLHDLREGGPTDGATCLLRHLRRRPPRRVHPARRRLTALLALTDAVLTYLVDGYYNQADELGVRWDDPGHRRRLGRRVADPVRAATESNPLRADLPAGRRPYWPMRT